MIAVVTLGVISASIISKRGAVKQQREEQAAERAEAE
jgi:putrescine transport system permease protein